MTGAAQIYELRTGAFLGYLPDLRESVVLLAVQQQLSGVSTRARAVRARAVRARAGGSQSTACAAPG